MYHIFSYDLCLVDDASLGLEGLDQHVSGVGLVLLQVGELISLLCLGDDASPTWGALTNTSSGAVLCCSGMEGSVILFAWLVMLPMAWGILASASLRSACCFWAEVFAISFAQLVMVPPAWGLNNHLLQDGGFSGFLRQVVDVPPHFGCLDQRLFGFSLLGSRV